MVSDQINIMKAIINIQLLSDQMFHLWATISSVRAFGFDYNNREPKQLKLGNNMI